jgi:hypothetical protein
MSLTVTIQGIGGMKIALQQGLASAVEELSKTTLDALVVATPVKSGRARRGWQAKTGKDTFTVENSVPYIQRLENNWSKQTRGRGIIGPALNQVKGKFK